MSPEKVWRLKAPSASAARLAYDTGLSPLVAQLLVNRGMSDVSSVNSFLKPRLSDIMDPMQLKGMDDALSVIWKVIQDQGKITIFGDYDADGLTATSLLVNFFSAVHIPVSYYIPMRLSEGYSMNRTAVEQLHKSGTDLIITVDCGSSNEPEISLAQQLGMKVVVTDHHQVPEPFSVGCPLINPHQPGCSFPFKDLSGVGVAFFLAIGLRACLRDKGWFKTGPEPDLRSFLDLVALGTVADRVSLLGQNRLLVNSGLEMMMETRWPGIMAMKEVSDIQNGQVTADDLAFRLGPRINAPGRMASAKMVVQLLTSNDPVKARELARAINIANTSRQDIERLIFQQIEARIESAGGIGDRKILFMGAGDWHRGVLGIVASKLVDKYYRPALIFCILDGIAVGSARSIDGFNLFQNLSQLRHLFEKFGGHAHAAGFTVKTEHLGKFESELESLATQVLSGDALVPVIDIGAEIPLHDIHPEVIGQMRALSPFGVGNPEPVVLGRSLDVLEARVVGENHLRLRVRQKGEGRVFTAIGFNLANGYRLEGKRINMAFTPEMNRWLGHESIQLRIMDIKNAEQPLQR